MHTIRFPNETPQYRKARNELLEAEKDLRQEVERVAALRRKLPLGGAVPQDYVFDEGEEGKARPVKLSELFEPGKDTLVAYSFMYGPEMKRACPLCTSILDSLDGAAPHVSQRVNVAVVAKSSIARIREFARERGWRRLRLLSSAGNPYNRDYHGEKADGAQIPAMNVFVKRDGQVHHFWNSELFYAPAEGGQDARHVDLIWPLWNVLDLTPEGRGVDFYPRLSYEMVQK